MEAGSEWTRYVAAFGGLAAIQGSDGTVSLQIADLHGDVVATAPLSETATEPEFTTGIYSSSPELGESVNSSYPSERNSLEFGNEGWAGVRGQHDGQRAVSASLRHLCQGRHGQRSVGATHGEGGCVPSLSVGPRPASRAYSPSGAVTALRYVKTTGCSEHCTWYADEVVPSIHGQTLSETSTLASQSYGYDAAGRLTKVQETPAGKGCTTRIYAYDADSNRTAATTREPGEGGACAESGGTTQATAFDAADRLYGEGVSYNAFGDITQLPAGDAGGSLLTSTYYADDSVASLSQDGRTLEYERDPEGRIRETLESGVGEGHEVAHFCGPGDSPAWTEDGSGGWTRYVGAFGGLTAIQSSGGEVRIQVADLHGDIVATAPLSDSDP